MTLLSIMGEERDTCYPMFHRYLKWNLSKGGEVSNERRNVPGNDGCIEEISPQGFINLGHTTWFPLLIVLEPHRSCETISEDSKQNLGTLELR